MMAAGAGASYGVIDNRSEILQHRQRGAWLCPRSDAAAAALIDHQNLAALTRFVRSAISTW
jgi:hypothetical protein